MSGAIGRDTDKIAVYSLTRDEAALRSSVITDVDYKLRLRLPRGTSYEGRVHVSFNLRDNSHALWLDFKAEEVTGLQVNGDQRTEVTWSMGSFT
jgi:hypothetical protein